MSLHWVLLLGVALNGLGALLIATTTVREMSSVQAPEDYWQVKLFFAGTAATFGAMYLYLFVHQEYVWPFLIFGAALKTWAFLLAIILHLLGKISKAGLISFGLTNGIIAAAFWIYLLT
ncbi:MAG: hypothetical protein ACRBEQ_14475 [Hyphomonas sp.]